METASQTLWRTKRGSHILSFRPVPFPRARTSSIITTYRTRSLLAGTLTRLRSQRMSSHPRAYCTSCSLTRLPWGDVHGQSTPPVDERFESISGGAVHTCGLRKDGSPVCWGAIDFDLGQASPPDGVALTSISSGGTHTCGLRSDGTSLCWGDDEYGQLVVPAGERFTRISSGLVHTCGLTGLRSVGGPTVTISVRQSRRKTHGSRPLPAVRSIPAACGKTAVLHVGARTRYGDPMPGYSRHRMERRSRSSPQGHFTPAVLEGMGRWSVGEQGVQAVATT